MVRRLIALVVFCLVALAASSVAAVSKTYKAGPKKITTVLRDRRVIFVHYPGTGPKILFAPGDAGFHGFAGVIGQQLAQTGFDVYGIDTKRYLESFTSKKSKLRAADVMSDFAEIASRLTRGSGEKITLVGWSEGAGLCLLAAANSENHDHFNGLVSIGISESSELGWKWIDFVTYITKHDPKEPMFRSADYLPKVAPLPVVMMQSTRDPYVSVEIAKRMYSLTNDPKQFLLIPAEDHHFKGNQAEFFRQLNTAIDWIQNQNQDQD